MDSVPDLDALAKAARERLRGIVAQIEDLARQTDPIELLAHLTLLFQTQAVRAALDSKSVESDFDMIPTAECPSAGC